VASKSLSFVLTGIDQSASSTLGAVGLKGSNTADKISGAFSKMGSALGGEFAELGESIGGVFESMGEEGAGMGTKLAAAGAAVTGLGAILTNMGSSDKQAQDQLKQAVENTGASWSDYSEEVEKTIGKEENYAHSATDTQTALRTLTTSTGDTKKAIDDMSVVTDLAAAKHESLADAATAVSKILSGTGAKTLSQYGITMATAGDKTANAQDALDQLSKKLDGQADASMDNWSAKVDVAKTKLEDFAAKIGEKVGPALTAAGPVLLAVGVGMDIMAARAAKATAQNALLAASADEAAAHEGEMSVAAAAAGGEAGLALGPIGIAAGVVVGGLALVTKGFGLFGGAAKQQIKPIGDLTAQINAQTGALTAEGEAQVSNTLATNGAYEAGRKLGISQNVVLQATMGNIPAQQQIAAAVKAADAAYKGANDSARTYVDANGIVRTSSAGATDAQKDAKSAADKLSATTLTLNGQLQTEVQHTKDVAASLKAIPADKTTTVHVSTLAARASVRGFLDEIPDQVTIGVNVNLPAGLKGDLAARGYSTHASGGVIGGQTIDEAGGEILDLPNGTRVYPHGQSQQMMRGAASPAPVINIYLQSLVPTHETGKIMVDAISQAMVAYGPGQLRASWLAA
jgi:hypothetical protein